MRSCETTENTNKTNKQLKTTPNETLNKVALEEYLSKTFTERKDPRQVDLLFTILFNFVLKVILQKTDMRINGIIYYKKRKIIAHGDDILLITI